eukprot:scaffold1525_cov142-Cylindrotheca_fusiformis.AAC.26
MTANKWRDTVFVWDGILEVNDEESKDAVAMKWEGAWVACENCPDARKAEAPRRVGAARDVESVNHFAVTGTAKQTSMTTDLADSTAVPHEGSLAMGEGWDMVEGDEKKKHKDASHEVLLSNVRWMGNMRDQRDNLVFAKGKNEFGSFISVGWMRPGCRLTLGRRYVDDNDARSKWDLRTLQEHVVGDIFDEASGEVRIPPWQCDVMHSDVQKVGKRKQ